MIDAGHGGNDSGAVGPGGLREKDVALAVAMLLGSLLVSDFEINYTRRDDTFVELYTRATRANDWQAHAFISIHCNSGPPGKGSGFEVFTTVGETASDRLATDLFQAFGESFPYKTKRMDMTDGDPDKESSFAVIRRTQMRAVLFELEFIHTSEGESWLASPANQAACAKALASGIRRHFAKSAGETTALPTPDRKPLEIELLAKIERIRTRFAEELQEVRTEVEALFRRMP